MNTTEQILAAARKRVRTQEIDLGGEGVKVVVRELTAKERRALDERLWQKGPDGKFLILDEKGQPSTSGDGYYQPLPGVDVRREWLLATLTPAEAVDGLLAEDVPESVKEELYGAARAVNGIPPVSALAKN